MIGALNKEEKMEIIEPLIQIPLDLFGVLMGIFGDLLGTLVGIPQTLLGMLG